MIFSFLRSGASFSEILVGLLAAIITAAVAIVFHEVAHGFAAYKCGDMTAKSRGRLTLNPIAHFDLYGFLAMLLVGFGWAKPVPINPFNFKHYKKGMVFVSLAGVVTNITLGLIGLLLIFLLFPVFYTPVAAGSFTYILSMFGQYLLVFFVQLNFMLAFFNILPIHPLDGFNLLDTFLPYGNKYSAFMRRYGMWTLIGLLLVCRFFSTIGLEELDVFSQFSNLILSLIDKTVAAAMGS